MNITRRAATLAALGASLPAFSTHSLAQAKYPNKPVKVLIGYPPGSASDTFGRAVSYQLQGSLGQPFVVYNRPGATTNIATSDLVHSTPDGYTILNSSQQILINPWLIKVGFDTAKDLLPVTQILAVTYVLLVKVDHPAKNLAQLIELTKKKPGTATYGTYGAGSGPHLCMVMLQRASGLDASHIPYRGSPQLLQALMAGEIDMCFDTTTSAATHVHAGKLRAIALGGPQPLNVLPGVPTIAMTYPGFDTDGWQGIFVPAGTSKAIVDLLALQVKKAIETPELKALETLSGVRLMGTTPDQFGAYVKEQLAKYEKVVKDNHITLA